MTEAVLGGRLKRLLSTGFFHIVGAGTLNKVLSMLLSIVLVRLLSKADYGCYAYAFNIASFFIIFNGLGASSAALQMCSELCERRGESDALYRYAWRVGLAADVGMAAAMLAVGALAPLAVAGSGELLMLYCAYPLLQLLCEMRLVYLRVWLENREYALMTNVQTALNVALSTGGALLAAASGLVVGQCLALLASWLVMLARSSRKGLLPCGMAWRARAGGAGEPRGPIGGAGTFRFPEVDRSSYWRIALVSAFNNGTSQALTLLGVLLVGICSGSDELVASYKVATTVPFAMLFVPGAVMTYAYPLFARNRGNREWTIRNYGRLTAACVLGFGALSLALAALARPVVWLLFGEAYFDCLGAFRILCAGFFLTAAFRQPAGNLLVTQRKLGFNAVVGCASLLVCLGLSAWLIPLMGMEGAAWAYVGTMVVGAVANSAKYAAVIRDIGIGV